MGTLKKKKKKSRFFGTKVSIGVTWSKLDRIFRPHFVGLTVTHQKKPVRGTIGHVSPHLWAPQGQNGQFCDFLSEKTASAAKTVRAVTNFPEDKT